MNKAYEERIPVNDSELFDLLTKFEFKMCSKGLKPEQTRMTEKDVDDIRYDKKLSGVYVWKDGRGDSVYVEYPNGICTLESLGYIHEGERIKETSK